jgi:hypothetical protein
LVLVKSGQNRGLTEIAESKKIAAHSGALTTHCAGIIMSTTVTIDPDLQLRLLSSDY